MSAYWHPINTSYTSVEGRFLIANDTEWVVVAINDATNRHFMEWRSTNQGDTWTSYDTEVVLYSNNLWYDAIVDDDGVIHVVYAEYDQNQGYRLVEMTRTAWQTWTSPAAITSYVGLEIYTIALTKSSTGEIALIWLQYYYDTFKDRAYGRKWTKANGWSATSTALTPTSFSILRAPIAATYAANGTVYFAAFVSGYVAYWAWGNTTGTTVVTSANIVTNTIDIITTDNTPHVLYTLKTPGGWGNDCPWLLYVDSTLVDDTDSISWMARFAERVDGTQVLYYDTIAEDDTEDYGKIRRCALTDGVPGTPADYIPRCRYYHYDSLTYPSPYPNTEGMLACTGYWSDQTSSESIVVSMGFVTVAPVVHSFPWVGKFQLCHKKV